MHEELSLETSAIHTLGSLPPFRFLVYIFYSKPEDFNDSLTPDKPLIDRLTGVMKHFCSNSRVFKRHKIMFHTGNNGVRQLQCDVIITILISFRN